MVAGAICTGFRRGTAILLEAIQALNGQVELAKGAAVFAGSRWALWAVLCPGREGINDKVKNNIEILSTASTP